MKKEKCGWKYKIKKAKKKELVKKSEDECVKQR